MESATKTSCLEMAVYKFWKFKEKKPLILAKFLKNVCSGVHFQLSYKRQACNLSKSELLHGDFFSILSTFTNTYFKEQFCEISKTSFLQSISKRLLLAVATK